MKRIKFLKGFIVLASFVSIAAIASCGGGGSGGGGGGDVDPTVCGTATQGCATGSVMKSDGTAWDTDAGDPAVTVSIMPLAGAQTIKAASGTTLATANAQGWFTASGVDEGDRVICFSATGYFKTCKTVTIAGAGTTGITPVKLLSKGDPIAVANVEAGAATALVDTTGAGIRFDQANSVCDADGSVVTGSINCYIASVDTTKEDGGIDLAPGNFQATAADGTKGIMVSSGMMAVSCEKADGTPLQICSGATAKARIPIYGDDTACKDAGNNPATIKAWRYDETTGVWSEYDTGNFTKNCGSIAPGASGANQYYEGNIDHMTWVNGDRLYDDACLSGTVVNVEGGSANALTTIKCWGPAWHNDTYANSDGSFCVPVPVGFDYTCSAGDASRWMEAADWKTGTAPTTAVTFPVDSCPAADCDDIGVFIFAEPIATTTLTWGALPLDLDSHFIPEGGTQIYFGNKDLDELVSVEKGSLAGSPYIALDTDDTDSYGPEVTTALSQMADGTYRFCVRNYSGETDGGLCASSAEVRVYIPSTGSGSASVSETRSVPTTCPSGDNLLWQVYEIVVSGGVVTSYTTLDTIVDSASATSAATDCFSGS